MFLTLCYAFLTVVVQRQRRRISDLIKDRLVRGTVSFHKSFCSFYSSFCDGEVNSSKLLLQKNDNKLTFLLPKQTVNLFSWTSFHISNHAEIPKKYSAANSVNILLETCYPDLDDRDSSKTSCLYVEEYCVPMAWRPNEMFGVLVRSSVEDLSLLGAAFLNDQLCMNEGMEIHKMMTVDVEGSPIGAVHPSSFPLSPTSSWSSYLLQSDSTISTPIADQTPELYEKLLVEGGAHNTEDDFLESQTFPCLEPVIHHEFCDTYGGSNESLADNVLSMLNETLSDSEMSMNDGGDSLCSQGSNEGEAASQASSPRKLMDSLYCNLRNSIDEFEEGEEYCAGEAMAEGTFTPIPDDGDVLFMTNGNSFGNNGNNTPSKPPNILIYTGEDNTSSCHWFQNIKENIQLCLNADCYTIYLLPSSKINSTPWKENTELLIVSCEEVNKETRECFSAFVNSGGKLLSFCSDLELFSCDRLKETHHIESCVVSLKYKDKEPILVKRGKYKTMEDLAKEQVVALGRSSDGDPLISVIHTEHNSGTAVVCQVHLEVDPVCLSGDDHMFLSLKQNNAARLSILRDILSVHFLMNCEFKSQPQLTPCYLFTKEKSQLNEFLSLLKSKLYKDKIRSSGTALYFTELENGVTATKDTLPVIYNSSCNVPFNTEVYYSNLKTSKLGKILLYVDVVPTTMTLLTGLTDIEGTIAISRFQTEGKGRGGNHWLSPEGCASFTLHVLLSLNSNLGQRLSFLQHLTSIAMIEAIKGKAGYENIDIKLKWPNDIYYKNRIKLGGVLVNSILLGGTVHCYIGCGVNINNSSPTMCINDIIKVHNKSTGDALPCLSVEEYIGRTVTAIEAVIHKFEKDGYSLFLQTYYNHWLHSGQKVTLHDTGIEVTIVGLDEHGYLQVQTSSGEMLTLQGDGNGLDMMRNLIVLKG